MRALRSRKMSIAVFVVTCSVITGIGLGLMLTKVVQAGDKKVRTAAKSPKQNSARVAANRGSVRTDLMLGGPRARSPRSGGFGQGAAASRSGLRRIRFDPRTLPMHGQPLSPDPGFQNAPHLDGDGGRPPIPMWTYNVTASPDLGGGNYSGLIIGTDPRQQAKVTSIPTLIVPLKIVINNGPSDNVTYDPTVPDNCINKSVVDITTQSPLFTNNNWTMNGVNVGNTQYIDAFQRAQFWSLVQGTNYHVVLNPTVLPPITLTFGSAVGTNATNLDLNPYGISCSTLGIVYINDLDNALLALMGPGGALRGAVSPGTFPLFAMNNVVSSGDNPPTLDECCIVGYHSFVQSKGKIQIYSPFDMDTSGIFGTGFTTALSHEIGEAINDPNDSNPTPFWGNIGQNVGGFCQNNFEVGDPLSPGWGTPTNTFFVTQPNGLTYGLQELGFFNWFYGPNGGNPMGAGGLYSNNGSFLGDNIPCPPGGTN